MKEVVIIGGMAAGCKTATRLKRLKPDFKVTIIEKKPFVSFGTCGMPFYASGDVEDFMALATTPWDIVRDADFFKKVKDVNVLTQREVISIDYSIKQLTIKNLIDSSESLIHYDYLVFATGAKPVKPPFECPKSDKILDFHDPLNAKKFKELAQIGKIGTAAIIGGGFIGVELAEAMVSLWGIETHLIELTDRLMPQTLDKEISDLLVKTLINEDVKVHLNSKVDSVRLDENGNPKVIFFEQPADRFQVTSHDKLRMTGEKKELSVDLVFTCIGIRPNTELAESIGVKKGDLCGIKVDEQLRTNIPDVWAAGDCVVTNDLITHTEAYYPLGSLANRQGKGLAESIAGLKSEFKGAIGTNSVKVFGLTLASAGHNENILKLLKKNYDCVWGTFYDRPDYMHDSKTLFGKLIYEKKTLKLLGLQLAGRGEVTRYIDVFSALASRNCDVYDLIDFEHAYTPTHSNPMNPLNFLGAMAVAQEIEGIVCLNPIELEIFAGQILDVREESEIKMGRLQGNVIETNISEYRNIIKDLERTKPLLIVCQKGPRSYEVARFFVNEGFTNVKYLGGGMQLAKKILDRAD